MDSFNASILFETPPELLNSKPPAIIERDPLRFWQLSCAVLGLLVLLSIAWPFI